MKKTIIIYVITLVICCCTSLLLIISKTKTIFFCNANRIFSFLTDLKQNSNIYLLSIKCVGSTRRTLKLYSTSTEVFNLFYIYIGVWCNGNTTVSKTVDVSSILTTPANGRKTKYKKHFIIINNYFVKLLLYVYFNCWCNSNSVNRERVGKHLGMCINYQDTNTKMFFKQYQHIKTIYRFRTKRRVPNYSSLFFILFLEVY